MKKFQKTFIQFEFLKTTILIGCAGTNEDFEAAFAQWSEREIGDVPTSKLERADGRTLFGDGYFAMWTRGPQASLVAHEAIHVVLNLLDEKGIKPDDEMIAYMVEYLVEEFMSAFS